MSDTVQTPVLTIKDKNARIEYLDPKDFNKLYKLLSFKLTGVEYSPAFRNGWNGVTYLMDKKGVFNTGLIHKVRNFLVENNIYFIQQDNRTVLKNPPIDISDRLKSMGLVPRDYQNRIVDAVCDNSRGIVRSCTGSGKSVCVAMATARLNDVTIVYVIGLDLLDQFHSLFSKIFDEEIGYIGNGVCDIRRINIASIWTIGRALAISKNEIVSSEDALSSEKDMSDNQVLKIKKLLKEAKVHFGDESHIWAAKTATQIYKNINPVRIYGFSGTPYRDDNSDLLINGILGEQIVNVSASELIERGVLPKPIIKWYPVPKFKSNGTYSEVYKECISENEYRNNLIVSCSKKLIEKNYSPLVLFKQIKHGNLLFEKLQDAGIKCAMLNGSDSLEHRNEVKKDLAEGNIDLIVASTIFDIGMDLPKLNAIVLGSAGKSTVKVLQRVGRALRPYPNKKHAAIVEFFDQSKYLKNHAMARLKVYESESGFEIIKCKEMK